MKKEDKKLAIFGEAPLYEELFPIARPTLPPFKEVEEEFKEVFKSGIITNSKYVKRLEEEIRRFLKVKNVVCLANCTLGLILGIKSLKIKGKVLIPSFTFCASVHALIWNNLTPIFIDCSLETFNINTDKLEKYIDSETSAILAVHIFGNPSDVEKIEKIAKKYSLKVIYDSAHAFGSFYKGKPLAGYGDLEVFSLSPTKTLVAGEGGVVVTKNKELAEEIALGRDYGNPEDYNCRFVGLNARMLELNAIIALKNLKNLSENLSKRRRLVNLYIENLKDIPGISFQKIKEESLSCYKDFAILIDEDRFGLNRDQLAMILEKEHICCRKYFSPPVHRQKAYKGKFILLDELRNTDLVSKKILCLPLFNHMKEEDIQNICRIIKKAGEDSCLIKEYLNKEY